MKRLLTYLIFVLLFASALAPESLGQVELFGGYSYLKLNGEGSNSQNLNGWEAGVSAHLIGPLALEADYSNHYGSSPTTATVVPEFTELYGPRFEMFRFPRIAPFVHGLFGAAHGIQYFNLGAGCKVGEPCPLGRTTENGFAMAFGGGLNIKATHHIWIRAFQVDYLRSAFNNSSQNDVRVSAGLVLRFGKW